MPPRHFSTPRKDEFHESLIQRRGTPPGGGNESGTCGARPSEIGKDEFHESLMASFASFRVAFATETTIRAANNHTWSNQLAGLGKPHGNCTRNGLGTPLYIPSCQPLIVDGDTPL